MSDSQYGSGMQISRHWRLNSSRYRLEGVRYQNGDVSLQHKPKSIEKLRYIDISNDTFLDKFSSNVGQTPEYCRVLLTRLIEKYDGRDSITIQELENSSFVGKLLPDLTKKKSFIDNIIKEYILLKNGEDLILNVERLTLIEES